MSITLPSLPYDRSALEPYISAQTLDFHYGKHHQAYVTNLNTLVSSGAPGMEAFQTMSLDEIILHSATGFPGVFNNAAQVWNHTFFWQSMKPQGGGSPSGLLAEMIQETFGGLDQFKAEFKKEAASQFGSGWAWLVLDQGKLKITKTSNADLPMIHGQVALLTCDVWEHAYYLDYQNRRPDYLETFLTSLVNWDFAEKNLQNAL